MTYEEQRGPTRDRRPSPLRPASTPVTPHRTPVPSPPTRLTGRYAC
ncbi:hypothetical protein SAFG77S_02054 [Streptomyces afghaniensis]